MKAIYWHDETMGADYTVEEIPANLVDEANEWRDKMLEKVAELMMLDGEIFRRSFYYYRRRNLESTPQCYSADGSCSDVVWLFIQE